MFDRILILVNGAPGDRYALEYGIGLARSSGAEVHLAGVVDLAVAAATIDEIRDVEDEGRFRLEKALRAAADYAIGLGQPVTTETLLGPLADTIARVIQARGIDVLVIGEDDGALSRGHRQLAQHAPCAVLVARARVIQEFAGAIGARTEHWSVRPEARVRLEGLGLMLQVFVGEHDRHDGRPVYEVVIERLRELDVAGAAVFRGELGFGAAGRLHAAALRPWSHDRPVVISAVDVPDAIGRAVDAVKDLVINGLIVTSPVEIIKYAHRQQDAVEPRPANA
jgi:hypothetical protein